LFLECALELVLADEALLDKEPTERPPRDVGRFHERRIGTELGEINSPTRRTKSRATEHFNRRL